MKRAIGLGQIGPTLTPTITVYETGNVLGVLSRM